MRQLTRLIILLGFLGFGLGAQAERHHANKATAHSEISIQKVDINNADEGSLAKVKGIGPKRAAAIVAYRKEHGPFKSVADLNHVHRIGDKLIKKVEGHLTAK